MALRVLLADESSTIKKVFQLALQDFAVEVKPVNVGLDVAAVAESFQPDIIFADVLLQKKNGYDVSLEIKQNDGLRKTPVVLMWSGFMDLDEDKMQASGADGQLEKPFDVKSLRKLVESLVPKTKDQKLSSFLSFPKLPDFEEGTPKSKSPTKQNMEEPTQQFAAVDAGTPPLMETDQADDKSDWNMDSFEPPSLPQLDDEFQEISLKSDSSVESSDDEPLIPPGMDIDKDLLSQGGEDSNWEQRDLGKYKIAADQTLHGDESEPLIEYIVPEGQENLTGSMDESVELEIEAPEGDGIPSGMITDHHQPEPEPQKAPEDSYVPEGHKRGKTVVLNFSFEGDGGEDGDYVTDSGVDPNSMLKKITAQLNDEAITEIIQAETKKIIEEQAKKIIEDAVWKVLPELTKQIVEREIQKLVDDDEVELS